METTKPQKETFNQRAARAWKNITDYERREKE
jgi:hypothetical protein